MLLYSILLNRTLDYLAFSKFINVCIILLRLIFGIILYKIYICVLISKFYKKKNLRPQNTCVKYILYLIYKSWLIEICQHDATKNLVDYFKILKRGVVLILK